MESSTDLRTLPKPKRSPIILYNKYTFHDLRSLYANKYYFMYLESFLIKKNVLKHITPFAPFCHYYQLKCSVCITKNIMINFYVGKVAKSVNVHLKLSIRAGVNNNRVIQSNETRASRSLRIRQTA